MSDRTKYNPTNDFNGGGLVARNRIVAIVAALTAAAFIAAAMALRNDKTGGRA